MGKTESVPFTLPKEKKKFEKKFEKKSSNFVLQLISSMVHCAECGVKCSHGASALNV